ncbi:GOLPH3/VPS74 family protein [Virgibacillus siamensis]|uniref:GOLPH3/VPS74 family protein n=1 Tax=Virgibacillus siamensis TaxID=480071 RepID=UPI00098437EF|nr:GPP34 family phosphoprotein [Virgibacillus siamensis]
MLTIAEELLLLALKDDKGTVVFSASSTLNYGLAGAILAELTLQERLELRDKKVEAISHGPTGDAVTDSVLQKVSESKRPKSVKRWVENLSFRMGHWRKEMLAGLVQKGILEEQEQKILWVFTRNTYPTKEVAVENQIRKRVYASLFGDEQPNARTAMLLSLIKACSLVNEVFPVKDQKEAKKKIDSIIKNNEYGKAVKASIDAMQTAVIAACAAAAASSAGSSGGGGS